VIDRPRRRDNDVKFNGEFEFIFSVIGLMGFFLHQWFDDLEQRNTGEFSVLALVDQENAAFLNCIFFICELRNNSNSK
jgi:hypothetical protein